MAPEPGTPAQRRRRGARRAGALVALLAAAAAIASVVPASRSSPLRGETATGIRYLEVDTTRTRRVVVPACDRRREGAEVARRLVTGDTVLTLHKRSSGPRVLRIAPCPSVANVVLTRPAVEVTPIGAPAPDGAVQRLVVGASSRARVIVVPRCRPSVAARATRVRLPAVRVSHGVAVAPRCG